jgi:hypothetical protein
MCSLSLRGLLRKEKDGMMWSKHQKMTERKIVQVIRSDAFGHEAKEIGRSNNNSSRRELKQGWLTKRPRLDLEHLHAASSGL